MTPAADHDYDWVIIGSGFGGSVAALRLAEKGYRVAVLECGRRFEDHEFPERLSQVRRSVWMPKLGLRGILRLTAFKDVMILSGSGVGGGSLVYAQTLYRAKQRFFEQWREVSGQAPDLTRHYDTAERMLGVANAPRRTPSDELLLAMAGDMGSTDSFQPTRVGVFLGEAGVTVPDPYFGGDGPPRTGCIECGQCMVGCRTGAKNTLVKNYLWLAERLGAKVLPDRMVTAITPLGASDGSTGYTVATERSGASLRKGARTITAGGVVVAAGALGTNLLLARCKDAGTLRISDRLGHLVRTNSESLTAVTVPDDRGWADSLSITSSIFPDADSHVEFVTYGRGGDLMGLMFTLLTPDGTRLTRPLKLVGQILRHPVRFARSTDLRGWSRRSLLTGVMQTLDNSIQLVPKKAGRGRRLRLTTRQDPTNPMPTFLPRANEAAERLAEATGGIAQSWISEALLNVPVTAHILGGVVPADDATGGVVDHDHRLFGYERLLVCDGSTIAANPGVNPSLTIAAIAERVMTTIPGAGAQ